MFGRPIPQFQPDADDLAVSRIANDLLAHAVERVIATGALVPDARAGDIAQWLWAVAHGVVNLELHDYYLALSLAGYVA